MISQTRDIRSKRSRSCARRPLRDSPEGLPESEMFIIRIDLLLAVAQSKPTTNQWPQ